jgi:hypothetical protein
MKKLLFALSLSVCAVPAFAQDQPPPQQGGGHGMFKQACGADIQNFCASAQNRDDRRACVMANKDKFSDSCKSFMASHPMYSHDQGQMQGPPPGGGQ